METYGVARFETSLVILRSLAGCKRAFLARYTYDIDTSVPRDRNHGVERAQIYANNTHGGGCCVVCGVWQKKRSGSRESGRV